MALETLKHVKSINNHKIHRVDWNQPIDHHIEINDKCNAITFKIQNGPIKEVGHNGIQIDEGFETFLIMLEKLNEKFPCNHNLLAIDHFKQGLVWLEKRKQDRVQRGVEGQSLK